MIALLRQRGRVTYRTLQCQFMLDDAQLAALKDELLYSQPHVVDDAGRGLVWTEDTCITPACSSSLPPSSLTDPQPAQPAQGIQLWKRNKFMCSYSVVERCLFQSGHSKEGTRWDTSHRPH